MAATMVQQMWEQLDAYTEVALEMGKTPEPQIDGRDQNELSLGEYNNEYANWARAELTRLKTVQTGRGLAEAIVIICKPFFNTADEVIKLSVKRVRAAKAGESAPETPGFMGQTTGEALHEAATGTIPGTTRKNPVRIEADPPKKTTPTQTGRAKPKKDSITDAQKQSIVKAYANGAGLDVETLAMTFGVAESVVTGILNPSTV